MSRRSLITLPLATIALAALTLTASAAATAKTQTLRFYDKPTSIALTEANGTTVTHPPYPQAQPGDTLDVNSVDYRGDHAHHKQHWSASTHLRCTFAKAGPPTCESHVALGNSLLVFDGNPAKLVDATGVYQGATGRVISSHQLADNASDLVIRIHLR
jgi:hypothetical protein